jgi:protein SCO1
MLRIAPLLALLLLAVSGCGRETTTTRTYELTGVILGIDNERRQVLVRHDEIPGFMVAMTMPFEVQDPSELDGRERGDRIRATLVVDESEGAIRAHLTGITRTGHVELEEAAPASMAPPIVMPGDPAPDAPLVDHRGEPLPLSALRGHRVALTFMFTRCPFPEFCPLMDRHFVALQEAIAADPALADVRLVSVTLDPDYDTPGVLATHAARLGADPDIWSFVTADPDALAEFSGRLGIYAEREGPGPADLVHNLRTAVIDADGRLTAIHTGNQWTPDELLEDLAAARR